MKTITFFGAVSNVGTTMIAQSVAESLGQNKKKVLLIFASSNYDDQFVKRVEGSSIDCLKGMRDISSHDLEMAIDKAKYFDFIQGIDNVTETMRFQPDIIKQICQSAEYDYVITDAGSSPVFPLGYSSLVFSDKRVYVTDQSEKARVRFKKIYFDVLKSMKIDRSGDIMVVNRSRRSGSQYSKKDIEEMFMLKAIEVPETEGSYFLEMEKKTLMYKSKFKKSVEEIVRNI